LILDVESLILVSYNLKRDSGRVADRLPKVSNSFLDIGVYESPNKFMKKV
jgi:hypothetical protein